MQPVRPVIMPPKGAGKKVDAKKADKIVEDKTFGLKNKNKSSKVQKYVQTVTAQARSQVGLQHKTEAQKKAEQRAKKEAKSREEEELRMLFSQLQGGAMKRSKAEEAKLEADQQKRDEGEGENDAWVDQDMTGKPIEEVIEYQRAKLAHEKKNLTPVTAETFAKWKAEKAEQRKRENAERVARELAKKAKGKGLSVLSGKALFEYDASLFVDDLEAGDDVDVTHLVGLMEVDEDGDSRDNGEDNDGVAVAVQERLYLDGDDDDDLDAIDDDDDEDDAVAAGGGGGPSRSLHEEQPEAKEPR